MASVAICNTSKEEIKLPGRSYRPQGWIIPPCPAGKRFSTLLLDDATDNKVVYTSYKFVGPDVINVPVPIPVGEIISDLFNNERLDRRGCFSVPATEQPSDELVQQAQETRKEWLRRLVDAGDEQYKQNGRIDNIPDYCKRAVSELGITREWTLTAIQEQSECPACGERIKVGVAICKSCGAILNQEKASQFGLVASVEPEKRKPGRPPKQKEQPKSDEIGGI